MFNSIDYKDHKFYGLDSIRTSLNVIWKIQEYFNQNLNIEAKSSLSKEIYFFIYQMMLLEISNEIIIVEYENELLIFLKNEIISMQTQEALSEKKEQDYISNSDKIEEINEI